MRAALISVTVLLTGTAHAADPPSRQADSIASLIDLLAKTDKPAAEKLDALFYATKGRFASGREHCLAKHKLSDKPTKRELTALVAELVHRTHFVSGFYDGIFAPAMWVEDFPMLQLQSFVADAPEDRVLVPNPLFLPPMPWILPGSTTPMPRTGFRAVAPAKP